MDGSRLCAGRLARFDQRHRMDWAGAMVWGLSMVASARTQIAVVSPDARVPAVDESARKPEDDRSALSGHSGKRPPRSQR